MGLLNRVFERQAKCQRRLNGISSLGRFTSMSQVKDNRAGSKSEVGDIGTNPGSTEKMGEKQIKKTLECETEATHTAPC